MIRFLASDQLWREWTFAATVFINTSELANKAAQTMSVIKKALRDIATGNTGLKSAQTATNVAIQIGFRD